MTDRERDEGFADADVRAVADHLANALDTFLAQHLPPAADPDEGPTPKAVLLGLTLFHAEFLVEIAQGAFAEAMPTFFAVQVRALADALHVLSGDEAGDDT